MKNMRKPCLKYRNSLDCPKTIKEKRDGVEVGEEIKKQQFNGDPKVFIKGGAEAGSAWPY